MRIFSNAWVTRRGADSIAALALELRTRCGYEASINLDVFGIIRKLERSNLQGKGLLKVVPYPEKPRGYVAFVSHNPLELHVERLTLERARWNVDAWSKYILSHEIGHMLLHGQVAVPFSGTDVGTRITGTEEEQAEWQANTFADHLLLPDVILANFSTVDEIVKNCGVSWELAQRRMPQKRPANRYRANYSGEACPECQNFTLILRRYIFECETCGATVSAIR